MTPRRRFLSVALAIGAVVGLIVPLHAAVADSSPPDPYFNFRVESPVFLVAKGAAVSVPVTITCFPEAEYYGMSVFVSERVNGGRLATGWGYIESTQCDGFPGTVDVSVRANENAFKNGQALVEADAWACTPLQCNEFREQVEVRIRKK